MKVTFLTPPSLDNNKPAERTAGCTRVVYNMANIYELTVVAVLEQCGHDICYKVQSFIHTHHSKALCIFMGPGATYFSKRF